MKGASCVNESYLIKMQEWLYMRKPTGFRG